MKGKFFVGDTDARSLGSSAEDGTFEDRTTLLDDEELQFEEVFERHTNASEVSSPKSTPRTSVRVTLMIWYGMAVISEF